MKTRATVCQSDRYRDPRSSAAAVARFFFRLESFFVSTNNNNINMIFTSQDTLKDALLDNWRLILVVMRYCGGINAAADCCWGLGEMREMTTNLIIQSSDSGVPFIQTDRDSQFADNLIVEIPEPSTYSDTCSAVSSWGQTTISGVCE